MHTDISILGGGLAGLAAGIMARRAGFSVVLVEKKEYPFHKVCGEYISRESLDLLEWLNVPLVEWQLPSIQNFGLSHPSGQRFQSKLPLGGIGLSRFTLDHFLKNQLVKEGGIVLERTKATDFQRIDNQFEISTSHSTYPKIASTICFGSFGRNKPYFTEIPDSQQTKSYFGVKFHLKGDFPKDKIELHHFPGGYCGISAIEREQLCMCYLLNSNEVARFKGDFSAIESQLLAQNPNLNRYLSDFELITERSTTSGVHFRQRPLSQDGMLFLGDSAGMIPPLAGNGMSMALHSAVLAVRMASYSLDNKILSSPYEKEWQALFASRLKMGRRLQALMENDWMVRLSMAAFSAFPPLFRFTARQTHGISIPIPQFSPNKG